MKKALVVCSILLTLLALGCSKSQAEGVLKGTVTIGPITPVEKPGEQPPVSPDVFIARKIVVYDSAGKEVVKTLDITQTGQTASGTYETMLSPGTYTVNINLNGIDRSSEVPKKVTITSGSTVTLDINIDTGIR